jgi:peptidoglycan/xylan/chitin deacetylase (PgdA/CDA1 family)
MRPPYGTYDRMTRYAATAAGEARVVLWDVDTRDWSGISWRAVAHTALTGTSGSIVLMHTMPTVTASALTHIIAGYRLRGFTFVTVGQLLGIDGPVPFG